jgi:hypothetical protein
MLNCRKLTAIDSPPACCAVGPLSLKKLPLTQIYFKRKGLIFDINNCNASDYGQGFPFIKFG